MPLMAAMMFRSAVAMASSTRVVECGRVLAFDMRALMSFERCSGSV